MEGPVGGLKLFWQTAVRWHNRVMLDRSLATVRVIASLEGTFRLRSGQVSTTYFDKYRFEGDPALLRRIAAEMLALVPPKAEVLAGRELD